jgi:hypothetical protein
MAVALQVVQSVPECPQNSRLTDLAGATTFGFYIISPLTNPPSRCDAILHQRAKGANGVFACGREKMKARTSFENPGIRSGSPSSATPLVGYKRGYKIEKQDWTPKPLCDAKVNTAIADVQLMTRSPSGYGNEDRSVADRDRRCFLDCQHLVAAACSSVGTWAKSTLECLNQFARCE